MKKSELIKAAIVKIESLRPNVSLFVDEYLASGLTGGFVGSEFSARYDLAFDSWHDQHFAMIKHLNVALSVTLADEHLGL